MTAVHQKFTFIIGDTWSINAACSDVHGNAIDLSMVASVQWQLNGADSTEVLSASLDDGIEIIDQVNGLLLIKIDAAKSATIVKGLYQDILRLTMKDGTVATQAVGLIEVTDVPSLTGYTPVDPAVVDYDDPCAAATALRAAYYQLIGGAGVIRVRFSDREVQYATPDIDTLSDEIVRLEAACQRQTPGSKPYRFAMKLGSYSRGLR